MWPSPFEAASRQAVSTVSERPKENKSARPAASASFSDPKKALTSRWSSGGSSPYACRLLKRFSAKYTERSLTRACRAASSPPSPPKSFSAMAKARFAEPSLSTTADIRSGGSSSSTGIRPSSRTVDQKAARRSRFLSATVNLGWRAAHSALGGQGLGGGTARLMSDAASRACLSLPARNLCSSILSLKMKNTPGAAAIASSPSARSSSALISA
ncbi:MAG: hypothetical protein FD119_106 [Stygiobacter sp.]|nr:MAG: hypothetical protein FD119_106 [Stygiobacter sp.]